MNRSAAAIAAGPSIWITSARSASTDTAPAPARAACSASTWAA